jgi:beta-lactamase regulating signal transducer with metallopeptidase domain
MTLRGLESYAAWVWDASWHAAIVVLVVLIVRRLARERIPPAWRCALWTLVGIRLLLFTAPQASWSLFGLLDNWEIVNATAPPPTDAFEASTPPPGFKIIVGYGPGESPSKPQPGAPPQTPAKPLSLRLAPIASAVWVTGAAVLLLRIAVARQLLRRRICRASPIIEPQTLELLERCRLEMKVTRPVALLSTDAVAGPTLAGYRHSRILLPPGLCARLSPEQLRLVFLHELAHVRRHDLLAEWLIALLTAVHWFNPAIWLAAHLFREDRELCRDAMVLRIAGAQSRRDYGHTLLNVLGHFAANPGGDGGGMLAVAMLDGGKRRLRQRIRAIVQLHPTPARITVLGLVLGFALLAWIVLTNPRRDATSGNTAPSSRAATGDNVRPGSEKPGVQAQLDRRLPEINLNGQEFADVLDFLRDVSGSKIVVNWRALEAAGINKDAPVTGRMKDVNLSKALSVILADVGGGNVKLGYFVDDDSGVITISTADKVVTTVYDVRDLLVSVPDFDSDVDFPIGGKKPVSPSPTTRPATATAPATPANRATPLIELIRSTIDPESWASPRRAAIREINGQLVIAQSREAHQGIVQLLSQLREGRAIHICVDARFICIDRAVLAALPPDLRDKLQQEFLSGKPQKGISGFFLDDEEARQFMGTVQNTKSASILSSPRLTIFNGQRAYVAIVQQRAYVADLKVNRLGDQISFDPVVQTVDDGFIFDVQGTISANRRYVTLTLRPRLMALQRIETVPFDKIPDDQKNIDPKPTVQRPVVSVRQLKTTVSVPDGGTLLLGLQAFAPEALNPKEQKDLNAPILGDIPHLGRLFNNQVADDQQTTLLIMVKPRIIMQEKDPRSPGAPGGR